MHRPHAAAPRTPWPSGSVPYLLSVAACGLTTLATIPLHDWLEPVNAVMLFLLTVALVAARLGQGPAVLASFLSVGLFDFFHVPPRFSFAVSDIQYLLTFAVMLTVALLIGQLATAMRQRADEAQQAADRAQALHALAHQLAGALTANQVLTHLRAFVSGQLGATLHLWQPGEGRELHLVATEGATQAAAEAAKLTAPSADLTLMARSLALDSQPRAHSVRADSADGSDRAQDTHHILLPLMGATRNRGVMLISQRTSEETTVDARHTLRNQGELLDAIGALAATALERLHFVDVAHQTELEVRTERLRNAILSALSHDVRTPLTALVGTADTLSLLQPPLTPQAQEMVDALRGQALRLHDMVSKLLDMARLQSSLQGQRSHLPLRLEWQPIEEVIGASIQLLGSALARHRVVVDLPPDLPLLQIDAVLMERVFGNLLDNAAKYAPPDTEVRIRLTAVPAVGEDVLEVCVHNAGPGFPPECLQEVFEPFARGVPEGHVPGMGLGLAICKAIVEAHGGRIEARNPAEGGAEVCLRLPLGTPPTIEPEQP